MGAFLTKRKENTVIGAPGAIRTPDPLVRSQILYPTELRVQQRFEFYPSGAKQSRHTGAKSLQYLLNHYLQAEIIMEKRFAELARQLLRLGRAVAVLDLEATGGDFLRDRMIEIAYLKFENGTIKQVQQLINPQQALTPFIEKLTGIDDALLADAPVFGDTAADLAADLRGCILVAHNSKFDYTLLKQEFERENIAFATPALCTVKLSEHLFPQEKKHSLDNVAERFGIDVPASRHRAMTDVLVLAEFLQQLTQHQPNWCETAQTLLHPPAPPPDLPEDLTHQVFALPDGFGTVIWHDDKGAGTVHACQQAYADTVRALARTNNAYPAAISGKAAVGILHALAQKGRFLQEHPAYTAATAAERFTVRFVSDHQGLLRARTVRWRNGLYRHAPHGVFVHGKAATRALLLWAQQYRICPQRLGLNDGAPERPAPSPEEIGQHNLAVQKALVHFAAAPLLEISETDEHTGQKYIFICQNSAIQLADELWYADTAVADAVHEMQKHAPHRVRERRYVSAWQQALASVPKKSKS